MDTGSHRRTDQGLVRIFEPAALIPRDLLSLDELAHWASVLREQGKRIGLCHGAYDVLHAGHLEHFREAKRHCDVLFVTITADEYILKPGKPVLPARVRARHLLDVVHVDAVAIVEDTSAVPAIEALRPHFYIKGQEYAQMELDLTGKIYPEKAAVERHGGRLLFTQTEIVFSSSKIQAQQGSGPYLPLSLGSRLDRILMSLKSMKGRRVVVIGEAITDRWTAVRQVGISSKAFCPAVHMSEAMDQCGGAGVIARHCAAFVEDVVYVGNAIDPRWFPDNVRLQCLDKGDVVINRYWVADEDKRLFETKHNTLKGLDPNAVIAAIENQRPDALIIADFGLGLLNKACARRLIETFKDKILIAAMAQANSSNFGFNRLDKYRGADVYVCDEREARLLAGDAHSPIEELLDHCRRCLAMQDNEILYVTLGRKGAAAYFKDGGAFRIERVPNVVRRVVDTIGCGDAFFSLAALCRAAGVSFPEALIIPNLAGAACTQWLCNAENVTPQHILDAAKVVI